jgi:hypothetical protein
MATQYPSKLSLRRFADILGIHPLHLLGINFVPAGGRIRTCDNPYFQWPWQDSDRVSREEMAQALQEAETQIEQQLHYRLLPSWENEEFHSLVKPRPELVNNGRDPRGYWDAFRTDWAWLIAGGRRGNLLLGQPDITWSDEDEDGYKETGTITLAVASDVSACEIRLYNPGKGPADGFEIKPIRSAASNAGTLTVTFYRECCVKPALYEGYDAGGIDGTDDTKFEAALDVYQVFNDRSINGRMLWEAVGGGCIAGPDQGSYNAQTAAVLARDARIGLVTLAPAEWDPSDSIWHARAFTMFKGPDAVDVSYYAGWQDKSQQCGVRDLDPSWARAITQLACSMLDRPPCDCTADQWHYYREDLAQEEGSDDFGTFRTPQGLTLDNPFGTRRGAVEAWRKISRNDNRIGQGVSVG